ncbi:glycosyltransferase family 4 protein [Candidatus Blastococcus massiliensis]|uniref:glycosyltransferase family 4 protein n=1 Tax=Candidatus Blastococcus massiliensis TaxID=1470358 RepID=UPI0004ADEDB2|nr:glycosyltransferase family 4 protein [Candidatus Blastococcus massiliensis]
MKIIIVTSMVPFVEGGAESLATWLSDALERRGHEVDLFPIPVQGQTDLLPGQMVGLRSMDFTGMGDRLIAIRTPSYLVRHHHKILWFIHHHRPSYDLWDEYRDVPNDPDGWEFRRMMFASDEVALAEAKQIFTNSARVRDRLRHYNGVDAEVLYPPLPEGLDVTPGPYGDYLFSISRIQQHKQQLLTVEAMAHTETPVRLVLAGRGANDGYAEQIERRVRELGLTDRVTFHHERVPDEKKWSLMSGALASVYLPREEDSYGYVGLESALARRPLVTATDSGGVLELVRDGVNGLVTAPQPEALAQAFDRLYRDRELAARLGAGHDQRLREMNIDWDHVVERLVS